ncbi:MAG: permease [Bacteroidota bacterium]|nr:permease [Bacteroidota bacterium]
MNWKKESGILLLIVLGFLGAYYLPFDKISFEESSVTEAIRAMLDLFQWYAREHVILCLLPAFLIAGVIAVFISQGAVIKYFGAQAKKWVAYSVAAVSGTILAVCSCTILPLFSSIHKRGAGLGPAIAFLYSGPAINILAIILTAKILGWEMGLARVIGAVVFAVVIGLIMAFVFRKEENERAAEQENFPTQPEARPMWQTAVYFFILVIILVFANWGMPDAETDTGVWYFIWSNKWSITIGFFVLLLIALNRVLKVHWWKVVLIGAAVGAAILVSTNPVIPFITGIAGISIVGLTDHKNPDNREWIFSSWGFSKQIIPLLAIGVLVAGFLLGSTHDTIQIPGIIPSEWIDKLVGGNSLGSNLFASVLGAFMYFATLTEVPILQGLMSAGMGKGPALALLLAGPSLSLPNMLVIRGIIGTRKTLVFVLLVVVMATLSGLLFGFLY